MTPYMVRELESLQPKVAENFTSSKTFKKKQ